MKKILILSLLLLSGCASMQLVSNWKNPDIVVFDAYKVLIVGMAQNPDTREDFETRMQREFLQRDVEAVRSIDVFDVAFTNSARSEAELSEMEQQLLDKDFDAILFTKVLGSENRQKFWDEMADLDNYYDGFRDDYMTNQRFYNNRDRDNEYKVYLVETSLYCICVDKERELIWRGSVEVEDPSDISNAIKDYIALVAEAMADQDIIFRKDNKANTPQKTN
jgi:hypothetical protein